jgi:excisionase family DNA binding protein
MTTETGKLLEVAVVAKRLGLHPATVRRMFAAGVLHGFKTGPTRSRIRIFESSVADHMQQNAQEII